MEDIVYRIGKNKISRQTVLKKEKDILGTLKFKLAGVPTVLEFLERYLSHQYFKEYPIGTRKLAKYLACL